MICWIFHFIYVRWATTSCFIDATTLLSITHTVLNAVFINSFYLVLTTLTTETFSFTCLILNFVLCMFKYICMYVCTSKWMNWLIQSERISSKAFNRYYFQHLKNLAYFYEIFFTLLGQLWITFPWEVCLFSILP